MPKTVVITQSNYIPWRGYFDMLRTADEVVLLDSVQYTRRDWRSRNRIKTAQGPVWLSIPVEVKGRFDQAIDETRIADSSWAESHIRSIETAYRRAACFDEVAPWLFALMREAAGHALLSDVNERIIRAVCDRLGLRVPLMRCTDVIDRNELRIMDPTERLLALAKARGATHYLSGPAAQAYLAVDRFHAVGIEVVWMSYAGYEAYLQLWGAFEPQVSVVDLLLNTGSDAPRYLTRSPS